jgi:hypothetical protein
VQLGAGLFNSFGSGGTTRSLWLKGTAKAMPMLN